MRLRTCLNASDMRWLLEVFWTNLTLVLLLPLLLVHMEICNIDLHMYTIEKRAHYSDQKKCICENQTTQNKLSWHWSHLLAKNGKNTTWRFSLVLWRLYRTNTNTHTRTYT